MIPLSSVENSKDKKKFLSQLDRNCQTFVVSDLKSKFEIQKSLLDEQPLLEEFSVLRASELWRKWCQRDLPHIQWISRDLLISYLQEKLMDYQQPWARAPKAATNIVKYFDQLLPLLNQSQGEQLMDDWFKMNPKSYVRWGHWYYACKMFWKELEKRNWAITEWSPLILLQQVENLKPWGRDLIFDLGANLTPLEADLIKAIHSIQGQNIKILEPAPHWKHHYQQTLWPYQILSDEGFKLKSNGSIEEFQFESSIPQNVELKKFSTQLAEVKDATSMVRKWLDDGLPTDEIAIVAPDIEDYWPVLNHHLEMEGVPVNKGRMARGQSFYEVSLWLSELRMISAKINSGKWTVSDLELRWFDENSNNGWSYDKFKSLFSKILDEEDLKRAYFVFEDFKQKQEIPKQLNRQQFVGLSLNGFKDFGCFDRLEMILQRIFAEIPPTHSMYLHQWVDYLERVCSKVEIKIASGDIGGIHCENLNSIDYLNLSAVYVLGAMESKLSPVSMEGLLESEVHSLSQNLGVHLQLPTSSALEFDLLWVLDRSRSNTVLSTALSQFSGGVEAPSKIWTILALGRNRLEETTQLPGSTRLDECQVNFDRTSIQSDLECGQRPPLSLDLEQIRLSASQIENYLSCPFKFMARKLFRLSYLPDLDLDLDHLTQGKVMHSLFEKLLQEPVDFDLSHERLVEIVKPCLDEDAFADEKLKQRALHRYINMAHQFLDFEKQWRGEYPETKTIGRELEISGFWSHKDNDLVPVNGDIPFIGYVDRLDSDSSSHLVLIDYKSSAAQARGYTGWIDNDQLQMAIYAYSLEKGLAKGIQGEVVAAHYYVVKDWSRSKGFTLPGKSEALVPPPHYTSKIDEDKKYTLYHDMKTSIKEVVEGVSEGQFPAQPKEQSVCVTCDWRTICRAPHLTR